MQPNWVDYLRFLISTGSCAVLTIAAIVAYIRLRRWTFACLFVAGGLNLTSARLSGLAYVLLNISIQLFGLDISVLGSYPDYLYESIHSAVWTMAIIGAAGELVRLTWMPAEDRGRPRPDTQVPGEINSPTGKIPGAPQ